MYLWLGFSGAEGGDGTEVGGSRSLERNLSWRDGFDDSRVRVLGFLERGEGRVLARAARFAGEKETVAAILGEGEGG